MKRSYLLLCVLFSLLCFRLSAQTDVYLFENFENGILPVGWSNTGGSAAFDSYRWQVVQCNDNFSAHSGNYCMRFNSNISEFGTTSVLISPSVLISKPNSKLSFYVCNPYGGPLKAYLSTDSGRTYLSTPLDTNLTQIMEWTKKSYDLNQYTGQSVSVVFVSESNNSGNYDGDYHYIDDVKFYETPACQQPINLFVSGITDNSFNVQWNLDDDGNAPERINVYYVNSINSIQNTVVVSLLNSAHNSIAITNLTPNTKYYIYASCDCGQYGNSFSSDTIFTKTLCQYASLPIVENFDALSDTILNCNDVVSANNNVWDADTYYGSYGKSVKLTSVNSSNSYFVSQPINYNGKDLMVDFMVKTPQSNTSLRVGLIDDYTNFSTFEPIEIIAVENTNTWMNKHIYLSSGRQSVYGTRLCIAHDNNSYVNIDDITISIVPTCKRVENLAVSSIDSVTATLSWNDMSSAASYQVECYNKSNNTYSYSIVNSNPCVVSNLSLQSEYQFRVRPVCGVNDTAEWSLPVSAITACGYAQLPLFEDFTEKTSLPECWYTTRTATAGWSYSDGWQINDYLGRAGECINAPSSSDGCKYLLSLPALYIPAANSYELDFWFRRYEGSKPGDCIRIYVNDKPSLDGASFIDSVNHYIDDYPVETQGDRYYEYYFTIPMSGTVYVMIESEQKYSGGNMFIDDISVAPVVTCRNKVKNVQFNHIQENDSIYATWSTNGNEQQWIVSATIKNKATNDVAYQVNDVVVNAAQLALDCNGHLALSTEYEITLDIRALCAVGDTSDVNSSKFSFATRCGSATLPFYEGFENCSSLPVCWSTGGDQNWTYWNDSYDRDYFNGNACLKLYYGDYTAYLSTPAIGFEAGKNYQISFSIYRSDSGYEDDNEGVHLWVSSAANDVTNAQNLGFISNRSTVAPAVSEDGIYEYTFTYNASTALQGYVVFQSFGYYGESIFLDDIKIEKLPDCLPAVEENIVLSATQNSISLNIKDNDKMLEMAVCADSIDNLDDISVAVTNISDVNDSTNTVTVANLNSETYYNVFVRVLCDTAEGKISDWVGPILYRTQCNSFAVNQNNSYVEDFESYDVDVDNLTSCLLVNASGALKVSTVSLDYSTDEYSVEEGDTIWSKVAQNSKALAVETGVKGNISRILTLQSGLDYELSLLTKSNISNGGKAVINLYYINVSTGDTTYLVRNSNITSTYWDAQNVNFIVAADGDYKVVISFDNSDNNNTLYIDNFVVRNFNCVKPDKFDITNVTAHSVDVEITGNATLWEVRLCEERPYVGEVNPEFVFVDTTSNNAVTLSGLQANTKYYCLVRALCNGETSQWLLAQEFTTYCDEVQVPYETSFEEGEDNGCWRNSYSENGNFGISNNISFFGTQSLMAKDNTVIMPAMDVISLEVLTLTGYVYSANVDSATFSVGVIANPYDITTYEEITTITVARKNSWEEFSVAFDVLSDADYADVLFAKNIAIVCGEGVTYYFDKIRVAPFATCEKPLSVDVTVQDAYSVSLNISENSNAASKLVSVCKGTYSSYDVVYDTIINGNSVVIEGLEPEMSYFFTASSICSANDTSVAVFSDVITTPCAVRSLPYTTNFAYSGSKACWSVFSNYSDNWSDYGSYFGIRPYYLNSTDSAFLATPEFRLNTNNGIRIKSTGHCRGGNQFVMMRYTLDGGNTYHYLNESALGTDYKGVTELVISNVGPGIIQLEYVITQNSPTSNYLYGIEVDELDICTPPVNCIFNNVDNNGTVSVNIIDTASNHTQWQFVYDTKRINPDEYTPALTNTDSFNLEGLDFVKYYFYVRSYVDKQTSVWSEYTFDVNTTAAIVEIDTFVCSGSGYVDSRFNVPSSDLVVGDTVSFASMQFGNTHDTDTLFRVNIYVPSTDAVVFFDTICAGDVYNANGFENKTNSGRYENHKTSVYGCDSVTILYLSVYDSVENVSITLCEGDVYTLGNQEITESGVYYNNYVNANGCNVSQEVNVTVIEKYYESTAYFCEGGSYYWKGRTYNAPGRYEYSMRNVNGCDSVLVLNLNMIAVQDTVYASFCRNIGYDFGGITLFNPGTYSDTLQNSLGCDSIVTLILTSEETPVYHIDDIICESANGTYVGFGFNVENIVSDTVLQRVVTKFNGCDSIVEVALQFIPTDTVYLTATINAGEVYEFGNNTYNTSGEYKDRSFDENGCDSITILTLTVLTSTSDSYTLPIVVAPNPVLGGQTAFVSREWTADEQYGMRVEVLNSVGQLVKLFTPDTFPIEISGLHTSGVYYIRITSGTGDVYLARLVVK